ncbi:MAG: GNAT family N-acetyltransferase [Streptosporangiaceae bacterium]
MPTWAIEEWPRRKQPDELQAELYEARAALHQEATPGDPRRPLADEIAAMRHLPAPEDGVVLVARDAAGAIAGLSSCNWERLPGQDHLLFTAIEVLPGYRRQGAGRLLLDRTAAIAEHQGLRLIMGRTRGNVPSGAAFCGQFGAAPAMVGEENRLDLHSVDRDQVDYWIADGPVRAPGYRLDFVAGRTPPELAGRVAEVLNVMNTAPRENLDIGDVQVTPELVGEYEDAALAAGEGLWAYYAVEKASGRFVGLTNIFIRPALPDRIYVGDTAVDPAHRGRGLGKWLKAAITQRILDQLPDVRWVITWNAGSNDAMLAINRQLGFRVAVISTTWQIPTDQLRARLADPSGRPAAAGGPAD